MTAEMGSLARAINRLHWLSSEEHLRSLDESSISTSSESTVNHAPLDPGIECDMYSVCKPVTRLDYVNKCRDVEV